MNDHLCGCGRPVPDSTICAACGYGLDAALSEIIAYRGLGWDLDVALAKQSRFVAKDAVIRSATAKLPYSEGASKAAAELKNTLAGWARVVADETGVRSIKPTCGPVCQRCAHATCRDIRRRPDLPPDTITGIAAWLRPRAGWLRHHPAGQEAHDEILDSVHAARRVCDRPADKLYAGPCDCGTDLYGTLGAEYIRCPGDHEHPVVWQVSERRRWLLAAVEDVLATTTEISRALTLWNEQPLTTAAIRGYVHRGQLASKGERVDPGRAPTPLYRVGDVLDILARQAERIAS